MHLLQSAAMRYTNYGTGGAFELPTQSGTLLPNIEVNHAIIQSIHVSLSSIIIIVSV